MCEVQLRRLPRQVGALDGAYQTEMPCLWVCASGSTTRPRRRLAQLCSTTVGIPVRSTTVGVRDVEVVARYCSTRPARNPFRLGTMMAALAGEGRDGTEGEEVSDGS